MQYEYHFNLSVWHSQLSVPAAEPLVQLNDSVTLLGVSFGDSGEVLI
jgi:hypothetical protein